MHVKPDEAMLKRIMAKTGADMALMMSLDELSLEPQMGMIEDYYKFKIKARIVCQRHCRKITKRPY